MRSPDPLLTRDLVLIGGGHAHALVLKRWGMKPMPGARLTLIDPAPAAPYTGMLPGLVAGHYAREELEIDLVHLARHAGARLVLGAAEAVDREARTVSVPGRPPLAYDVLSIDIGITGDLPDLDGFCEHAVAAKPLGPFADGWTRFAEAAEAGARPPVAAVIGGGVAGVELSMAMAHRLRRSGLDPQVTLIEAGEEILKGVHRGARRALERALRREGIALRTGMAPSAVTGNAVLFEGGDAVPAAFTVAAAGASPYDWLERTGLPLHEGYVAVDETLRSVGDASVFAAGDCAHLTHAPRPKAGVFAVREAKVLEHNLRAALGQGGMKAYRPQKDYLKLVSTGRKAAVADRFRIAPHGPLVWRLKDRIDRRFIARLKDLPVMGAPSGGAGTEALPPLCGGCGAKAGRAGLSEGLAQLPAPRREDVLSGPGDDAAILRHGSGAQVLTTDHLRGFTEDVWLMTRIAAIHALGDVWAMGAAPQAGLLSLTLPRMTPKLQARTLAEATDAAACVLREAGADLVGGHTSLGAELSVGLSATGLTEHAVEQHGAQPGDLLLLTKPIGTGVLMAALMAGKGRGRQVAGALDSMSRSPARAASWLAPVAHAMTDVTGFGLAGHLLWMMQASGTAAELDGAALPVLDGAVALAAEGVRSSLWTDNHAFAGHHVQAQAGPLRDLLFDPQTAGGMLASVPAGKAESVLAQFRAAGEPVSVIGQVTEGPPRLRVS
ncbi:selenide, water dikinase SelD [Parvularcula oceani]|uniref:selenide, water dikinase SelD n=1 Tax=Parvularcula oceani TaxID=1247963 RepID=UPI0004E17970|nr:selenide, water dikinase SelD [Parvularcula oceani]